MAGVRATTSRRGFPTAEELHLEPGGLPGQPDLQGKHGLSLKLDELEKGVNDAAAARAVVIHGANYVNDDFARVHGRLGRSWGCPAVDERIATPLIRVLQGGDPLLLL